MKNHKLFSRSLDTNGDGTGVRDMLLDYSGNPTEFKVTAQRDEVLVISRALLSMQGATINNPDVYGGGAAALTNGTQLYVTDADGSIVYHFNPLEGLKSNAHYAAIAYDVRYDNGFGAGNDQLHMRWTFTRFSPYGVVLEPGWSWVCLCEDDMRTATIGLVRHIFVLQGYFINYGDLARGAYS